MDEKDRDCQIQIYWEEQKALDLKNQTQKNSLFQNTHGLEEQIRIVIYPALVKIEAGERIGMGFFPVQ